jgi:hypothetical protein
MARIYQLPIQSQYLQKLSPEERALLLLIGYSANQIMMLQKLIWFGTNGPTNDNEIELLGSLAQSQMLLRLLVGVLSESWRVVTTRYLQSKLVREEYSELLDDSGKQALESLKKQFGKGSLITKIRNNYSFHFPDNADVETAFEAAVRVPTSESNWMAYFSDYNANTLFQFSEFVLNHGVMQQIGVEDEIESHTLLIKELTPTANDLVIFAKSFTAAVWKRHFQVGGTPPSAQNIQATSPDTILLPFVVDPPNRS